MDDEGFLRRRISVKVAPRALLIALSLWERVGARETIMVPTTYIFRGGVGAMIVSQDCEGPALRRSARRVSAEASKPFHACETAKLLSIFYIDNISSCTHIVSKSA